MYYSELGNVMKEHKLPLIQLWVPYMCDGTTPEEEEEAFVEYQHENSCSFSNAPTTRIITQLCLDFTCYDDEVQYYYSKVQSLKPVRVSHCVNNEKSLIGRAYSKKRACFFRDTSQFSILDYPIVPFTRSSRLAACFAIPFPLVHPNLPPSILEVFLPPQPQYYSNGDLEVLLKSLLSALARAVSEASLLSALARAVSEANVAFESEQEVEFNVEFSHSDDDNFEYFDVYRNANTSNMDKGSVIEGEEQRFPSSDQPLITLEASDQPNNAQDSAETSREEQQRFPSSDQPVTLEASNHPNTEYIADLTPREACINGEAEITLDIIKQYFGKNLEATAKELGVSRSTFKRKCRAFGIRRWTSHKRKVHIQSNPGLPTQVSVEVGAELIQGAEIGNYNAGQKETATVNSIPISAKRKSAAMRDDKIDGSYIMTIKATYKGGDTVEFRFCSNLGLQELRKELAKRFKLETENFKIMYEDEEESDWILIPCDEDLRFHMDTLKSSGQTKMKLLVHPIL